MTDYERGRLAGFAEGVEAAARRFYNGRPGEGAFAKWVAREIRALRAPPPAAGRMAPGVEGEPASGYGLHPAIVVAPSPKEDAPRCPACESTARSGYSLPDGLHTCGGTGRSTTGGGR